MILSPPARRFVDPDTGLPSPYARKAHARFMADHFYLARQPSIGHAAAARMTCEKYGHDGRGGRCERCGLGVVSQRLGVGRFL